MAENGNGNTSKLIFWILGALLAVIGILSGIAHSSIMSQLESVDSRIGRIETILLNR